MPKEKPEAQKLLEEMGCKGLPKELREEPLDKNQALSCVDKLYREKDEAITAEYQGIARPSDSKGGTLSRGQIMNNHTGAKQKYNDNEANRKKLEELINSGEFSRQVPNMTETFKNADVKEAQKFIDQQYEDHLKERKAFEDKKWLGTGQFWGSPNGNLFLFLLQLIQFVGNKGIFEKKFEPKGLANSEQYQALDLSDPKARDNFITEAKEKFGDDIEIQYKEDEEGNKQLDKIQTKDLKTACQFNDWSKEYAKKHGAEADKDKIEEALNEEENRSAAGVRLKNNST